MDSRLFRMFCAVAKCGSVAGAAAQLHLTASAISHALKALETDLGCRLFDRAGKKLLLNHAGEQLLARVQRPLAELDAAADSIRSLRSWGNVRLRIGAAASACQYVLPGVLRELKKSFGSATFQIESGDMHELMPLLHDQRLDLVLGVIPQRSPRLDVRPVFKDELLFVFAPTHSFAAGKPISREDLRTKPLILYQRSSVTAQLVDGYFHAVKVTPSALMEIANIEAIKELVKLDLGVSVLAPWTASKELARRTLLMRPLGGKPLRRQWVVASLADRRLNLIEETFCRLCKQVASGLRTDRRDVPDLNAEQTRAAAS
jgi:DNA-binding transcriptional LysR family regulator